MICRSGDQKLICNFDLTITEGGWMLWNCKCEISIGIPTVCSEMCSHGSSHVPATTNCFHSALGQNMQWGWEKMERKHSLRGRLRVYTAFNKMWILMALGTTGVQILMASVGTVQCSISKDEGQAVYKLYNWKTWWSQPPSWPFAFTETLHVSLWQIRKVLYMTKDKIIHWAFPSCFSVVL